MKAALAKHDAILKEAIESNHGHIIKTTGDGVHAVFTTAIEGVNAAIEGQRRLGQTSEVFETSDLDFAQNKGHLTLGETGLPVIVKGLGELVNLVQGNGNDISVCIKFDFS